MLNFIDNSKLDIYFRIQMFIYTNKILMNTMEISIAIEARISKQGNRLFIGIPKEHTNKFEHKEKVLILKKEKEVTENGDGCRRTEPEANTELNRGSRTGFFEPEEHTEDKVL